MAPDHLERNNSNNNNKNKCEHLQRHYCLCTDVSVPRCTVNGSLRRKSNCKPYMYINLLSPGISEWPLCFIVVRHAFAVPSATNHCCRSAGVAALR